VAWFTKGAEAGLPVAMFNTGVFLEEGRGVAAPDYQAAVEWFRRAADAGDGGAAGNLCRMYTHGHGRAWQLFPASSSSTLQTLVFLALKGCGVT
jgi:hypothetical protein